MNVLKFFTDLAVQMKSPQSSAPGAGAERARRRLAALKPLPRETQEHLDARYRKIRVRRARRWLRNQADDATAPPAHIERTLRECV